MNFYDKYLGNNSKIGKGAKKVSDLAGGRGITEYAAGRGTKKEALKSVGKVALSMAAVGGGIAAVGAKVVAKKAIIHGGGKAVVRPMTAKIAQETKTLQGLAKTAAKGKGNARKNASKSIDTYFKNKKY